MATLTLKSIFQSFSLAKARSSSSLKIPQSRSLLVKNGTVVTCRGDDLSTLHLKADVLVEDGIIAAVGPHGTIKVPASVLVVDATDRLVCPGFVDTHRHVWESAFKWMADWTLVEYVAKCLQVLVPNLDPEAAHASQLMGNLEALSAGVTTIVDHCHLTSSPEIVDSMMKATVQSGIRSFFCYARWEEWPDGTGRKQWQMEQLTRFATEGTGSDRVTLGLAVDGQGDAFFEELRDDLFPFAKKHNIDVISTHSVGGLNGIGAHTLEELVKRELLDRPVLFVHGNNITPDDHQHLKASGSSISCTPEVELAMSHGEPVGLPADAAGVRVGLGVDCSTVVSGDMFSVMRSLLSHQRGKDNHRLAEKGKLAFMHKHRCQDAFRLATIGGARAIHREHMIGSIEVGKRADLLLVETTTPSMLGAERDPVEAMVMHCTPSDITMVVVDGEIVVDRTRSASEGMFTRVKWADVVKSVRETAERLRKKQPDWDKAETSSYDRLTDTLGLADTMAKEY